MEPGGARVRLLRHSIPLLGIVLGLAGSVLASTPWLRSFPTDVIGVPLVGAAVLSVLVPVVVVRSATHRLWVSVLIDVLCFVVYTQLVVLHAPASLDELVSGLYHGPSQILTFALPLVSPRSLMVAPVALAWLAGAIAGECLARGWTTMMLYAGFLVTYGLSYAATVRATDGDAGSVALRETIFAAALLLTLLLLRAVRNWTEQDADAESTQPDGVLPLRGLAVGSLCALLIAGAAGAVVQSSAFTTDPTTPQRVPSVRESRPLTPVSFISGLRPTKAGAAQQTLFTVRTDRAAPGYFSIANVDFYDGAGWSFQRTFRPSGGVLPADTDTSLDGSGVAITQHYEVAEGPLTSAPWMAYLSRPQEVTGIAVNIDPASGMIVPTRALRAGDRYTVHSVVTRTRFGGLRSDAVPDATTPSINTEVPAQLRDTLGELVDAFAEETGTSSTHPIAFLQALQHDLRSNYALTGQPGSAAPRASTTPSGHASSSPSASAPPVRAGSMSFADVLASIVGPQQAGTPEQYATLVTLVARQLGVPARVVTGFRVTPPGSKSLLPAGTYQVTPADAWTWVEIPVVGSGWVVLDAAPGHFAGPRQRASVGTTSSPVPTLTPTRNALITQGNAGHAVATESAVPGSHGGSNDLLLTVLIVVAALILFAALAIVLLRKQVRASRRRHLPDPRRRLVGAWQEGIDLLRESGLPELSTLTSAEIAFETARRFGPEPAGHAHYLGSSANAAVYSQTAVIDDADADAAWAAERELRHAVRRQLGLRARLVAGLRYQWRKAPPPVTGPASWHEETDTRRRARGRRRRRAH